MAFFERIKEGLRLVRESFGLLWRNKFLVVYPFAAMLIFALIQCLLGAFYGVWCFNFLPDSRLLLHLLSESHYIILAVLLCVQSFLTTFFAVALAHHTAGVVHRIKASTVRELLANFPKMSSIIMWTVILVAVSVTQHAATHYYTTASAYANSVVPAPQYMALSLILLAWVFFTCYVIPIIALEQINLVKAIAISMRLVRKTWLEIISGFTALLILTGIMLAPAVFWFTNVSLGTILVTALLIWPVQCIGSAISTMFTTLAYHYFYKQPMEEVDMLRYPEF